MLSVRLVPTWEPAQEAVPDVSSYFRERKASELLRGVGGIEEAELDPPRVLGIEREIHPQPVPGRPQWGGLARKQLPVHESLSDRSNPEP